jgi:hypothetical protein
MSFTLIFHQEHDYTASDQGITVPVILKAGMESVQLFAKVDTGAEYCFFERGFAEALGLDIENGTPLDCRTVAGGFRAYGHELTLSVLGVEVNATIYFYESESIRRNVLGRNGWLNRIRLGVVDHESLLYVSSYND